MSVVCLLNVATAPATEPQELVTHPPHLKTLPVSYQSQPAGVDQPQPVGVHQPQPAGVHQPQAVGVHQPQPIGVHQPQPVGVHQPQPAGVHQPQPIGVHQPMPVTNRNLSAITEDGTYVDKVITIMYYN